MVNTRLRWFALAALALLAGCSYFRGEPAYYTSQGETASVESIELAFADGRGVGAFVSSIDPAGEAKVAATQRFRVSVVFDSGNHTTMVQDGTVALAIGQRVELTGGRALPTSKVDKPHPAPAAPF